MNDLSVSAVIAVLRRKASRRAPHGERGDLLNGAANAFVLRIFGFGVGYLFTLVATRTQGPAVWGSFALCLSFILAATIVARLGFDTALLRLIAQGRGAEVGFHLNRTFSRAVRVVTPWAILVASLGFVGAGTIAEGIFGSPALTPQIRIAALAIVPTAITDLAAQSLRGLRNVRSFVLIQYVLRYFIPLLLYVVLVTFSRRSELLVVSFTLGAYVLMTVSVVMVRNAFARVRAEEGSRESIDPGFGFMLSLSLPLLLASSAIYLKAYVDTIMIGVFLDVASVGIYAVALKLATLITIPLFAVNAIAAPRFAEAFGRNDGRAMAATFRRATKLILVVSTPLALPLVFLPRFTLGMFGSEFRTGGTVLVILALAKLFSATCGSVGPLLQMTGRQKAFQSITLLAFGVALVLNVLLIPRFGIIGAALSTAAATLLWNVTGLLYLRRFYPGLLPDFLTRHDVWAEEPETISAAAAPSKVGGV